MTFDSMSTDTVTPLSVIPFVSLFPIGSASGIPGIDPGPIPSPNPDPAPMPEPDPDPEPALPPGGPLPTPDPVNY